MNYSKISKTLALLEKHYSKFSPNRSLEFIRLFNLKHKDESVSIMLEYDFAASVYCSTSTSDKINVLSECSRCFVSELVYEHPLNAKAYHFVLLGNIDEWIDIYNDSFDEMIKKMQSA
jgi:hypothetical protein